VRASRHDQVIVRRYRCLKCQRTFRVNPTGASAGPQSDTLNGLSVLLYRRGLSNQGVSDLLGSLGWFIGKSTVYSNVRAAGAHVIQVRGQWLPSQAGQVPVLSGEVTYVKCHRLNRIVAVATAVLTGQPVTFDLLKSEQSGHIERWLLPSPKR
jgi:hypothetical protein